MLRIRYVWNALRAPSCHAEPQRSMTDGRANYEAGIPHQRVHQASRSRSSIRCCAVTRRERPASRSSSDAFTQAIVTSSTHALRSSFVEAASGCDASAADPKRFDRTMLLDRRYPRAVRLDAAIDVDLAHRAARLDAQRDGGQGRHYALD